MILIDDIQGTLLNQVLELFPDGVPAEEAVASIVTYCCAVIDVGRGNNKPGESEYLQLLFQTAMKLFQEIDEHLAAMKYPEEWENPPGTDP